MLNNKVANSGAVKAFRTRFFCKSAVQPDQSDAALACNFKRNNKKSHDKVVIEPRVFSASIRISDNHNVLKNQNTGLSNCNNADVCNTEGTNNVGESRVSAGSDSSNGCVRWVSQVVHAV